jgi:hypothetical protein
MSSQSPKSPETVNVPKNLLVDLEKGFSRLAFVLSNIIAQLAGLNGREMLETRGTASGSEQP